MTLAELKEFIASLNFPRWNWDDMKGMNRQHSIWFPHDLIQICHIKLPLEITTVWSLRVATRKIGALTAEEDINSLIVQVVAEDADDVGGNGSIWTGCIISDNVTCTTGEGMRDGRGAAGVLSDGMEVPPFLGTKMVPGGSIEKMYGLTNARQDY
ncbi:hypothetical protein BDR04DRAFT_1120328 [Suillus decipiens]|nr:hypothetical protein BDR04DRAFT_1120328 [Suillus decipiens]